MASAGDENSLERASKPVGDHSLVSGGFTPLSSP
jgi:hypothetical protein